MWTEMKQQHLKALLLAETDNILTESDSRELENLLFELEQEEWGILRPTLTSLREEQHVYGVEAARPGAENALSTALAERCTDSFTLAMGDALD
jgi:hypothetical protein